MLVAALEVLARSGLVDPRFLPPASRILATTGTLLLDPAFLAHVAGTLAAWGIGLALAALVAVPLGAVLGSSRRSNLAAVATVELLRPIPSVALIPPAILLLGRGLDMKIVLVAYASTWPILLNTVTGVRALDPMARDTARAYGLGRFQILWRISLPSAAPFVFTGLRISAAIALIVAVSAELIAGGGLGIGTWMLGVSQAGVPRELVYAGAVVSGLLGLSINGALLALDRRWFGWHRARGEAGS